MADHKVNIVLTAQDKASAAVRKVRGDFASFKKEAMKGFGLGAGISVFNTAQRAIGAVVDVMGDAIQAAIDDEASTAKLTQALESNIEGWDGQTGAIDAAIDAGQKLAFTDDDLRDSMGRLVVRTHDVEEALRLQQLAMDLARGRGIDLAAATDLVGKAYNGQVGALRKAGLAIDKNATSTEALAAIQKAYGGQAATYAKTAAGQFQAFNIQVGELQEDLGRVLIGPASAFIGFLGDIVAGLAGDDGASAAMREFTDELHKVAPTVAEANQALADLAGKFTYTQQELDRANAAQRGHMEAVNAATTALIDMARASGVADVDLSRLIRTGLDAGDTVEKMTEDLREFIRQQQRMRIYVFKGDLHLPFTQAIPVVNALTGAIGELGAAERHTKGETRQLNKEWRKLIEGPDQNKKSIKQLTGEVETWRRKQMRALREGNQQAWATARDNKNHAQAELDQAKHIRHSFNQTKSRVTALKEERRREAKAQKLEADRAKELRDRLREIEKLGTIPVHVQVNFSVGGVASLIPLFGGTGRILQGSGRKHRPRSEGHGGPFGNKGGGLSGGHSHDIVVDGELLMRAVDRRMGRWDSSNAA